MLTSATMPPRFLRALACLAMLASASATTAHAPAMSRRKRVALGAGAGIGVWGVGRMLLQRRAKANAAAAAAAAPAETGAPNRLNVARADALLRQRTPASLDKAAAMYEAEIARCGDEPSLLLKAADAVNAAMRIRTVSNTISIDGTTDTPERKKVWAKDGARALDLATRGLAATPTKDARALGIYADAFMFSCSHKSLVKQALTGSGTAYKKMAEELQAKHATWDSDVGSAILACFYHVAPWPVGSADGAIKNARRAVKKGGPTLRNCYYVGVISYCQGDFATASEYFAKALAAKPGSLSEADFAGFMKSESKRALALASAKLE